MTPQELRNSILQLAIQGKLVEQRPEEGTAEELLARIKDEKQQLMSSGKIPKEKKLSAIKPEEIPYDIPSTWEWVRVQDVASYITDYVANGSFATLKAHTKTYKEPNYALFVRTIDLSSNFKEGCSYIDKASYDFLHKSQLFGGELILPNIGASIGKAFIMPDMGMPMSLAPNSILLKFTEPIMNEYFLFVVKSTYGNNLLNKTQGGSATAKFSKTDLRSLFVPLPPLAEQKRIVAKIEELLPLVDRYEKAYNRLNELNRRFPEDMRKSLLQLAIQGKLVEQRPEEGTAEELYRQIQAEKQALIKAGKIKKEKPLPEIGAEEIPFDIPESWKWVRIGSVFSLQAGKNINSSQIANTQTIENQYLCYGGNGIRGYVAKYNHNGTYAIIGRQGALCGNINFASGMFYATEHAVIVHQYACTNTYWCGFFLKALNLNKYSTATAQPGLAVSNINAILIPLPPLAEQKRIAAKLEELLPLCERLQ